MTNEHPSPVVPVLGVSACLRGHEVRFDGGHKHDKPLEKLSPHVRWVPVCPEMGLGLGSPRETLRLEQSAGSPRLIAGKSGDDLTEKMATWSQQRVTALQSMNLDGFVFKSNSPTCGLERVKIYDHNNVPKKAAQGIFARELTARMQIPVEEEGRLRDAHLRRQFLESVWIHARLRKMMAACPSRADLMDFHHANKLFLLSRDPAGLKMLGRLLAQTRRGQDVSRKYAELFCAALVKPSRHTRHVNVLQHVTGFLSRRIPLPDLESWRRTVELYQRQLIPRLVALYQLRDILARHQLRDGAVAGYLGTIPVELGEWGHAH